MRQQLFLVSRLVVTVAMDFSYILLVILLSSIECAVKRGTFIGDCIWNGEDSESLIFLCYDQKPASDRFFNYDHSRKPCSNYPYGYIKDSINVMTFQNCALQKIPVDIVEYYRYIWKLNISDISLESLGRKDFNGKHNQRLRTLVASHNLLTEIEPELFSGAQHILDVDFSFNKIKHIASTAFTNAIEMLSLDLSNNNLTKLEDGTFQNLHSLNILLLRNNQIDELNVWTFAGLGALTELDLSYNKINRFDSNVLADTKQLLTLDLSHNEISNISENAFESSLLLEDIDLSYNRIGVVEPNTFSVLKQLKNLSISHNEIKNISKLLLENTLQLDSIDLSYNEIIMVEASSFAALNQLTSLDLSFNNIKKLTDGVFYGLDNLQFLGLNHLSNETIEIEPLAFLGLNFVTQLDLAQNRIKSFRMGMFEGLHNLSVLDLNKCIVDELDKFAFSGVSLITELDLSRNRTLVSNNQGDESLDNSSQITILDKQAFDNLTNLIKLNLANNAIGTLNIGTFSKLEQLKYLNLSNTNLTEIGLGTFSHTKNLQSIDLSWNQLKTIDFSLFLPRYPQLQSLYLNENHLTELEGFTHTLFPSLKILDITGNHFNCSYLKEFLKEKTWLELTFVTGYRSPLNPYERNIHGIKCEEFNGNHAKTNKIVIFNASTTTTTITEKSTTAIVYDATTRTTTTTAAVDDFHETAKFNQENSTQEKCINFDTNQFTTSLTNAFSVFSQEHNDLQVIKTLLLFMSFMFCMLFLIVVIINRDKIFHLLRFSTKSGSQPRGCITNDIEVTTFSHESNNAS